MLRWQTVTDPIKITFLVTNQPHCITAQYIIDRFHTKSRIVDISFIIQDKYTNTNCRQFCSEGGNSYHELPRGDGGTKSLWNTPNCIVKNIKAVRNFYVNYLSEYKPDIVVIVPYENGAFEVELITVCKRFGIKTLLLQEGFIITDENKEACLVHKSLDYFLLNPAGESIDTSPRKGWVALKRKLSNLRHPKTLLKNVFKKVFLVKLPECRPFGLNGADYVGTLSPYYSNKLIDRGLSPQQLRPVGLARFDEIKKYRNNATSSASARKNEPAKLIILSPQSWGFEFGTPPSQFMSVESEIKRLKIISESFPDRISVKYRIRPEENIDRYRNILNETTVTIVIEEGRKLSTYESIMKSDVIITTGSTMLLETLALSKIGILFDPSQQDYYGYVRDGGCLMAYDDESLVSAIKNILQYPEVPDEMRRKARRYVWNRAMIDGRASERTCRFIEDIVRM